MLEWASKAKSTEKCLPINTVQINNFSNNEMPPILDFENSI